ncbi:Wzz/FepE/Etk N-terminal domain-containing protein [Micromonospora sp. NPDC050397]|uniref:Wzz/FepE/Etk N-terminal domain-containing protein n=1 Tax=Micromonospora sp. NPDC050397 TaxID=3364279 RepID=UPI00384B382E
MTLPHQLQALRTFRWLVVGLMLVGGAGAALYSTLQTPQYKANTQLLFSPNFANTDINGLNEGGNYILQRVRSYVEIANNPGVTSAVIDRLGLPYSPDQLMSRVTVTSKASSAVVTIEVTDSSPERARDIANAMAEEVPPFIDKLETPTGINTSPVKTSIVRPATTPGSASSPQTPINVGLGLVGGLAVGLVGAVVGFASRRTVRDEAHATEVADLALLGITTANPKSPDGGTEELTIPSETFRQIRTNMHLRAAGQRLTSVTVTGSVPDEGKGLVAANLAVALARAGETVVLVDADFRNPSVDRLFGVPNELGLADLLRDETSFDLAGRHWRTDLSLYLLTAGTVGGGAGGVRPAEPPLRSDRLVALLESFRVGGAFVVVNAPPMLSDAEAMTLASTTDATMVTARIGYTEADRLAAAVQVLRTTRANLLGLIAVRDRR